MTTDPGREPRTDNGLFLRNGLLAMGFDEESANEQIVAIEREAEAAAPAGPRAQAELGVCPVCENLFREDGHSFDCPLRAAVPAGLRSALESLAALYLDDTDAPVTWVEGVPYLVRTRVVTDIRAALAGTEPGLDDPGAAAMAAHSCWQCRKSADIAARRAARLGAADIERQWDEDATAIERFARLGAAEQVKASDLRGLAPEQKGRADENGRGDSWDR